MLYEWGKEAEVGRGCQGNIRLWQVNHPNYNHTPTLQFQPCYTHLTIEDGGVIRVMPPFFPYLPALRQGSAAQQFSQTLLWETKAEKKPLGLVTGLLHCFPEMAFHRVR